MKYYFFFHYRYENFWKCEMKHSRLSVKCVVFKLSDSYVNNDKIKKDIILSVRDDKPPTF